MEVAPVVVGAVLGILVTGFGFAVITRTELAVIRTDLANLNKSVENIKHQFDAVMEWRLRARASTPSNP